VRTITVEERRHRLGRRHRLAGESSAANVVEAAEATVALHGTDAASVYLAAWARLGGGDVALVDRALYEERSLLRILSMRRTMFVTSPAHASVMFAACSRDVAARERAKLLKLLAEAGVGDEDWLAGAERAAIDALHELGEATAPELGEQDPRLGTVLVLGAGTKYEARQKVISRILTVLGARGEAIRTRPRGGWTSGQFHWSALDRRHPGLEIPASEPARERLAQMWLRSFGPGTVDDLRWWTGWTLGTTRAALEPLDTAAVDLDGEPGLVLADDLDPEPDATPWSALLPALDPTTMGWRRRDWYLGAHGEKLFDRNGNAGPTIWSDGRAVGGWAQAPGGEIRLRLLEDVGTEAEASIEAEAAALAERVGDAKLGPRARGRSPVEAELLS